MKKGSTPVLCLLLVLVFLTGCGAEEVPGETLVPPGQQAVDVGICLPEKAAPWDQQGMAIEEVLSAEGQVVQVDYAHNDAQVQLTQVMKLIENNVKYLVIAPVDSLSLLPALELAKQKQIPVIAYDRLLLQSDSIMLYIAFDDYAVGKALGEKLVKEKALQTAAAEGRSYTVELIMGSPEDHGAVLFSQGLLSVLQAYLDSGVLVCRSGRTAVEDTCVVDSAAVAARQRLQQYLKTYYTGVALDLCIAADEELASGCNSALQGKETLLYTSGIRQDYSLLTDQCIAAVRSLMEGKLPENITGTVHNGTAEVNAWLAIPELG